MEVYQLLHLTVHLALTCVACDIPAIRKVLGFYGICSTMVCNKCYKPFQQVREGDSMWTNYSGFDTSQWVPQNNRDHREHCEQIHLEFQDNNTLSALRKAESKFGLRYSVLLELPYFDPTRYAVVDPMHNLF